MNDVKFRNLLSAELLKMWSLRSTPWVFLATALAAIGFNAGEAYDRTHYWTEQDTRGASKFISDGIPVQMSFTDNASLIFALAVTAIGIVAISGEYSTGLIRTTFTAVPARRSVMAAKALVMAGVMSVFGALIALVSFYITQGILGMKDVGVAIDHPGALRGVVASALLAPVCALVGMGIGTLLRHAGPAMVAGVVILLLAPFLFSEDHRWSAVLNHALPMSAWRRLLETPFTPEIPQPWTTTGAWIVYAAWALGAVVASVTVVQRRDQ